MQTDITRQSFGATLIQFVFLAALLWTCGWYDGGASAAVPPGGSIYIPGNFIGSAVYGYPAIALGASLAIIFVNAFIITRTVSRNLVYPTRTYLPSIFYLLVSCGIIFPAYDLPAVAASYLMVCATVAFISSFVRTVSFGTTFRGAFLIGLTPLLEPQNAIYIVLVPIATLVFRRCARETIVALLGALFPSLLAAYAYWLLGYDFTGLYRDIWNSVVLPDPSGWMLTTMDPQTIARSVSAAAIALVILLSGITFLSIASDIRTRAYKVQVFALWFLALAASAMVLPSRTAGNFTVLAIPASIIAPAFFVRILRAVPFVLYLLVCAAVAAAAIVPLIV